MIIGRYFALPVLFVAVVLQTTLLSLFQIRAGHVDLVLLLVIGWAVVAGPDEAALWAIIGGVLQDLATGIPLGWSSLALVIVSFGVGMFALNRRGPTRYAMSFILAAAGTAVYQVLLVLFHSFVGYQTPLRDALIDVTFPSMALNAIFMLFVVRIMASLVARTTPKRVGSIQE